MNKHKRGKPGLDAPDPWSPTQDNTMKKNE